MNPFLQIDECVKRLLREFEKHGQLVVAFDFDDTVFNYHDKEFDLEANVRNHDAVHSMLRTCKRRGFPMLLLTASAPERFGMMTDYCASLGFKPNAINANAVPALPFGHHGKPYYNILLDDRAGLPAAFETLRLVLAKLDETHPLEIAA